MLTCMCVCISVCTYVTVKVVLTCCAGHTSHSEDLLNRDSHCRLNTDHRPPLAPETAAEKHRTRIKYGRQRARQRHYNETLQEKDRKTINIWIQEMHCLGMSWEEFECDGEQICKLGSRRVCVCFPAHEREWQRNWIHHYNSMDKGHQNTIFSYFPTYKNPPQARQA